MTFLINPYRFGVAYDTDAQAYITAVETADGQALETGVKDAINAFVVGCKADGIWTAIKASCILAGARTLAGALQPLVGTAPTNVNSAFVSGDYDRKTGLKGNGSSKYLNTNYSTGNINTNDSHLFLNGSSFETAGTGITGIGAYNGLVSSNYNLFDFTISNSPSGAREYRAASNIPAWPSYTASLASSGSLLGTRPSNTSGKIFQNGSQVAANTTSATQSSMGTRSAFVFCLNDQGTPVGYTASRFNFFSIGTGLSDAASVAIHTRVSSLMTAIAAAIP